MFGTGKQEDKPYYPRRLDPFYGKKGRKVGDNPFNPFTTPKPRVEPSQPSAAFGRTRVSIAKELLKPRYYQAEALLGGAPTPPPLPGGSIEQRERRRFQAEAEAFRPPPGPPVARGVRGWPAPIPGGVIPAGGHIPIPGQPVIPLPAAPVPIVPPGAVLPLIQGVNLGIANPVGVLSGEAFATSWNGLGYMVDMPLKHGGIRLAGYSASIVCNTSGKRAKGDIASIVKFIKKHFRLGGRINGTRKSSQGLIRYIVGHLPGRFEISP